MPGTSNIQEELSRVIVRLRGVKEPRQFNDVISWGVDDDFASVRTAGGRVHFFPVEVIEEWNIPYTPPVQE